MKRLDSCEGGHVTRLVKGDKDSVIMLLCIGTSRTHKCAATAPSLGSKRPDLTPRDLLICPPFLFCAPSAFKEADLFYNTFVFPNPPISQLVLQFKLKNGCPLVSVLD